MNTGSDLDTKALEEMLRSMSKQIEELNTKVDDIHQYVPFVGGLQSIFTSLTYSSINPLTWLGTTQTPSINNKTKTIDDNEEKDEKKSPC